MRKVILLLLLLSLCLTSCANPATGAASLSPSPATATTVPTATLEPALEFTPLPFAAQYFRISYSDDAPDAPAIITSLAELNTYCAEQGDSSGSRHDDFIRGMAQYSDMFFEDHNLIFIHLIESTGSIWHNVRAATWQSDGVLAIQLTRYVPLCGTSDMAGWRIAITIPKIDIAPDNIHVYDNLEREDKFRQASLLEIYNRDQPFGLLQHCTSLSVYSKVSESWTEIPCTPTNLTNIMDKLHTIPLDDYLTIHTAGHCTITQYRVYNPTMAHYEDYDHFPRTSFDEPGLYPICLYTQEQHNNISATQEYYFLLDVR